jgi:molybdopterin-guanine dinucleotide biosynthesis protein A
VTLARRIAELFVAPPDGAPARDRSQPGTTPTAPPADPAASARAISAMPASAQHAPAVALLAPPADAPALGAALALALARAGRAPVAVVCVWSATQMRPTWRAPARPAAARLAAWLDGRGHSAHAAGRLVLVRLADAEDDAATEALRVSAAVGAAPTVLALAGPRRAAFDVSLAAQDLVVVAVPPAADPALAQLALAGLDRALICPLPPADPARALAAGGLALLPSTRRALAAAVAAIT